jgi:hypothetical protein
MSDHSLPPPRGVLHPELAPGHFVHRRIAPADDLAPWIEHHWYVAWHLDGRAEQVQETLPHPNVHLVLEAGTAQLWGISPTRFTKRLSGQGWVYGLKFRVGGMHAFRPAPVAELRGRVIPASEVFGPGIESLAAPELAQDFEALCARTEAHLRAQLPARDGRAERVAEIVRSIAEQPTLTSVDLGYFDQAHFIRDFRRLIGCSPAAYGKSHGPAASEARA